MFSSFPPNGRPYYPSVSIKPPVHQPPRPSQAASVRFGVGGETQVKTATAQNAATQNKRDDYSIWRDTNLRYGGYADEVGEFLTPYLGGLGKFVGYGLSTLYCMADMGTTLPQKYAKGAEQGMGPGQKLLRTGQEAADLGLFHAVASLWIPPMLIGAGVDSVNKLLDSKAHVETPGDPIRKGIMGGLNKLVDPVQKPSQNWIDRHWVEPLHPFVQKHLKAGADRWIQSHNKHLAGAVGFFANISDLIAKTPGIRYFWGADDADGLRRNMRQIGAKTSFQVDDLTRLLFVKPLPVLIGIGMVPLIAHPFDKLMIKFEDWTIRLLTGKNRLVRGLDGALKTERNPAYWTKQGVSSGSTATFTKPGLQQSGFQAPYGSLCMPYSTLGGNPFASLVGNSSSAIAHRPPLNAYPATPGQTIIM